METTEALMKAGRIASQVREKTKNIIKVGTPIIEICDFVEENVRKLGGASAFPCNVDVNQVAAHYTSPVHDVTTIPQNSLVKKLIDEGRIGRVLWMTAVFSSGRPAPNDIRLNRALCGGILMDKGSYCVNTARYLLESEPTSVHAWAEFGEESGVDERMTATLAFPGGQVVQFDCSFRLAAGTWQQGYEVYGESGRIRVPTGFTQVELYHHGEILDVSFYVTDSSGEEEITCRGTHQYQLEAEYFADRVLQGKDIEWPSESGLANMRVIDAIYASAREGRTVPL